MNVALVCPYDLGVPGGVQDQVIRLHRWIGEAGHSPTLVGVGESGPDGAVLLGRSRVLTTNRSTTPITLDPRVGRRLGEVFDDMDVVHIHEPLMPTLGIAASRHGDLPKVGTFHADPPRWVRNGYRLTSFFARRIVRNLDVATATSPVSRSAVDSLTSVRIVPNGVDLTDYNTGPKVPGRVAFLGRDDERKGLDVLLKAWPEITAAVPHASLTVIGAERASHDPSIRYLGRVSEETKQQALAAAEVYCAPNLGGESFGIVLVEAMASGCALVVSALPAFTYVTAGTADLVAPGEPSGLVHAVVRLLGDPRLLAMAQSDAIERASAFDGPGVAAQFLAAYAQAIVHHRGVT
jgi:phosphatidylinositol alpha-mannosyltransferase